MTTDKSFEERIAAATSTAEIQEICIQSGERQGVLVRQRDGSVTIRETSVPSSEPESKPAAVAQSPANPTCMRVIYPHMNDRYELFGASEKELDERERQIRAMFGR
jgi:hypothetical protein